MRSKVRILKTIAGPQFCYHPGQFVVVARSVAEAWILDRSASLVEHLDEPKPTPAPEPVAERAEEIETGTADPVPEKAVRAKRTRRDRLAEDYEG